MQKRSTARIAQLPRFRVPTPTPCTRAEDHARINATPKFPTSYVHRRLDRVASSAITTRAAGQRNALSSTTKANIPICSRTRWSLVTSSSPSVYLSSRCSQLPKVVFSFRHQPVAINTLSASPHAAGTDASIGPAELQIHRAVHLAHNRIILESHTATRATDGANHTVFSVCPEARGLLPAASENSRTHVRFLGACQRKWSLGWHAAIGILKQVARSPYWPMQRVGPDMAQSSTAEMVCEILATTLLNINHG